MPLTEEQQRVVSFTLVAIVDAVRAAGPLGAPAGPIYAALMSQGCTRRQYDVIMSALVRYGKLRQVGDLYFIAEGADHGA